MRTAVQKRAVPGQTHLPHTEKIQCAFCKGTGKDPFGQLYPGSTCQVCKGRREIYISAPYQACRCCRGTGVAFSMENTCTACMGRGVISLGKRLKGRPCGACGGTGMDSVTTRPCLVCGGLGEV